MVLAEPSNLTTELDRKLAPLIVMVKPGSPAVAEAGDMLVRVGAGLLTVKGTALEVPPPGAGLVTAI